jgi:hypothetical protein
MRLVNIPISLLFIICAIACTRIILQKYKCRNIYDRYVAQEQFNDLRNIWLIIFTNFICLEFSIINDVYLIYSGVKNYFTSVALETIMLFFARNMSIFFPLSSYLIVYWPKKVILKQHSNYEEIEEPKLKETFSFDLKVPEDCSSEISH